MFDFTSNFWPWFITIISSAGIIAMWWLVRWMDKKPTDGSQLDGKPLTHVWDDDLVELNNPLPSWWKNMFYATIIFSVGYLALYPGLGTWQGLLGWTQENQYEREMSKAEETFGPIYASYLKKDVIALAADTDALKTGRRLFNNYCALCHGSDAAGSHGFPNLTDSDWLYGGKPENIKASINNGRNGAMPAWGQILDNDGVFNVSEYILSLGGRDTNPTAVAAGKQKYSQLCVACHSADAKGNQALGAPDLTDKVWLYGASQRAVMASISEGRTGNMPSHKDFLDEGKIHVLTAYIYSLSAGGKE
ncbi:MAG: cytochrome-c oxidase, cbb3-type subunit III [Sulfuriflexus sp.]|nr:cytochrome-c oxidase, cbb3-type subunit III [Sulfuriflexus sp.]